uniref:Uncharacterized protein n=1 Tax=Zooxanthella nutricula TaxID=1333877 RepID=A0A7S2KF75_9DINO
MLQVRARRAEPGTLVQGDGGAGAEADLLRSRLRPGDAAGGGAARTGALPAAPLAAVQEARGGRAIAIAGGGWRAYSVASAVTAAMQHELALARAGSTLKDLFSNVSKLSSNSGGSWFAASLIYSEEFVALVHAMAADPLRAGKIFNALWTTKLLAPGHFGPPPEDSRTVAYCLELVAEAQGFVDSCNPSTTFVNACVAKSKNKKGARVKCKALVAAAAQVKNITLEALMATVRDLPIPWMQDYWQAVYIFGYTGGMTWSDIVEASLEKTVNIPGTTTLGSEPQPWARGKEWIACTSVPTPPLAGSTGAAYAENITTSEAVFYQATAASRAPTSKYIPARFSVVLGQGEDAQAPYPFCASPHCFGYVASIQTVTGENETRAVEQVGRPFLGDTFEQAFSSSTGRLPVHNVAASSSAALASSILTRYTAWAGSSGCVDLATWASDKPGGAAYASAQGALDQLYAEPNADSVNALHELKVQALFDGAYTDNSGISWAVASGAAEVTFISNGNDPPSDIWGLGAGADPTWGGVFGGVNFNIFEQTSDAIEAQYTAMPKLQIPPAANNTWLQEIVWGSMYLTTVENKWFGIQGGRPVRLNIISVQSKAISMAGLSDYWLYGQVVNDVTTTFADAANAQAVKTMLNEFFAPLPDVPEGRA